MSNCLKFRKQIGEWQGKAPELESLIAGFQDSGNTSRARQAHAQLARINDQFDDFFRGRGINPETIAIEIT